MKDKTHSLTIYLIKPGTARAECLSPTRKTAEFGLTFSDGSKGSVFTETSAPHEPGWVSLLTDVIPNLPQLRSSSASAVLFVHRGERLFALTFGYGRNLLVPGSWDENFGLKVTLNSVDNRRIRTVDRTTLDAIGQHSRIQASREAAIGEFGLDLEQDFLQAVTGTPVDKTLGKQLTGKDALNVKLPITIEQLPGLLDRYVAQYESEIYRVAFPWLDQIHEVKHSAKIADLDAAMVERIRSEEHPEGLWLSIPEIIDWTHVDVFKYRDAKSATPYVDVHINDFVREVGGPQNVSIDLLKRRRHIFAVSQQANEVYKHWTVYRCLYCEINQADETYLLNNGNWYRLGTDFRKRINEQFDRIPACDITFPEYNDKSESVYNSRIAAEHPEQFALMDEKHIRCDRHYDKVEFCDLFDRQKRLIHVKRYLGSSAPLSHLFSQAVVSAMLLRRDSDFRQEVIALLTSEFQSLIHEPEPGEYEVVLAIVSKSKRTLTLPFFSRVNLNNAWTRLEEIGFKVSLAKIQA